MTVILSSLSVIKSEANSKIIIFHHEEHEELEEKQKKSKRKVTLPSFSSCPSWL